MLRQGMFADSLLETSWAQRSRRSWTTVTSFVLEALVIGLLLLLPLWNTVGLPAVRTVSTPVSLGRPEPAPVPRPRSGTTVANASNFDGIRLIEPGRIPPTIRMGPDNVSPQPPGVFIPGTTGIGSGPGLPPGLWSPGGTRPVPQPPAPAPTTRVIRTSIILEGNLIHKVLPVYPSLARSVRIQGPVVLVAIISKAGTIDNLRAISGHPMLIPAALDAVSRWRYRPYILNNEPIEVETQITVNFLLSGN